MDANQLRNGAELFAELDPMMQISSMLTFLFIAQRGIASQKDVENMLGLSNAAASRNVSYWAEHKKFGVEGYGFVERFEDPRDRRAKLLRLTPAGKRFYDKIKEKRYAKTSE